MGFISKWVFNTRNGRMNREIDPIRSRYPYNASQGYAYLSNTEYQSILAVPSTFRFMMQDAWIMNNTGPVNQLILYDGSGVSMTMGGIHVPASDTVFIDFGKGYIFRSNVCVSNLVSNVLLRVGGILLQSDVGD